MQKGHLGALDPRRIRRTTKPYLNPDSQTPARNPKTLNPVLSPDAMPVCERVRESRPCPLMKPCLPCASVRVETLSQLHANLGFGLIEMLFCGRTV